MWFFLEPLLGSKAENSSFLRKLTENIKQVQDARDPENESANEVWLFFKLFPEAIFQFPKLVGKSFPQDRDFFDPHAKSVIIAHSLLQHFVF